MAKTNLSGVVQQLIGAVIERRSHPSCLSRGYPNPGQRPYLLRDLAAILNVLGWLC